MEADSHLPGWPIAQELPPKTPAREVDLHQGVPRDGFRLCICPGDVPGAQAGAQLTSDAGGHPWPWCAWETPDCQSAPL